MKWQFRVVCPKCNQTGFPHVRPVQSYYYPRSKEELDGYSGDGIDTFERKKKGILKRKKFNSLYICHYNREKYNEQMKDYRNGTRKSRPNGRECHYILKKSDLWIEPLPETGEKRFRTSYFSLMQLIKKIQANKSQSTKCLRLCDFLTRVNR